MGGEAVWITEDTADILWDSQELSVGAFSQGCFVLKAKRELLDLALWDADTTWQKGCAQIEMTVCV